MTRRTTPLVGKDIYIYLIENPYPKLVEKLTKKGLTNVNPSVGVYGFEPQTLCL